MSKFNRRDFLKTSGLASLALGMGWAPFKASANPGNLMNMMYVFNGGGWDPTRVLANCFEQRAVAMEEEAGLTSHGDLTHVSHPDRPSVDMFFERHHERALIANGVLCPSVAHGNCRRLMMTGTTNDGASDWPAIIAGEAANERSLPEMVLSGPSYPGAHGKSVTRSGNGGLPSLLSGSVVNTSDLVTELPSSRAEDIMDNYMLRRSGAAVNAALLPKAQSLYTSYESSLVRGLELKNLQGVIDFNMTGSLTAQGNLACDLLQMGISRCVMMNHGGSGWDSHTNNDQVQSQSWESLFAGLLDIMDRLQSLPGNWAPTLADETILVVMSEMARTPGLNGNDGKDHWPVTSQLIVGPGLTGGRVIGATNDLYYGKTIDPESGELYHDGIELSVANMGATLLAMAGVDPGDYLPGVPPISGVLS